ncbi:MAG: hypothetical protein IT381_10920 [Deltaproteobacteria bacterium]|nr:hypothetical protein [Deltaproteobacteria bacterium]
MKTAISIPDELFRDGERLAKSLARSRSQLYADALREYLTRRAPDGIETAMNAVLDSVEQEKEVAFSRRATQRTWKRHK